MARPRLLITGAINRPDILAILDATRDRADLEFVEYSQMYSEPLMPERYAKYGPVSTWEQHRSAHALLDRVRPDAVVAFYVSSLNQVALRVAAHERGIPTLHLEHGIRLSPEDPLARTVLRAEAERRFSPRRRIHLRASLGNYRFAFGTLARLRGERRAMLARYLSTVAARGATFENLQALADIRRPDGYVTFSPQCFAYHENCDQVPATWPRRVVGFPQFDAFTSIQGAPDPKRALLIDHQFQNLGLFGWNAEFRTRWVARLVELVDRHELELIVKEHPEDRSNAWAPWSSHPRIHVVDREAMMAELPSVSLVLGSFSTLQIPVAALPHTALITLEIHPEDGHFPSRDFVATGAATPAFSWDELDSLVASRASLVESQAAKKPHFVEQFLHRLDGCASERVAAALTSLKWAPPRALDGARK